LSVNGASRDRLLQQKQPPRRPRWPNHITGWNC